MKFFSPFLDLIYFYKKGKKEIGKIKRQYEFPYCENNFLVFKWNNGVLLFLVNKTFTHTFRFSTKQNLQTKWFLDCFFRNYFLFSNQEKIKTSIESPLSCFQEQFSRKTPTTTSHFQNVEKQFSIFFIFYTPISETWEISYPESSKNWK